MQKTLQSIDFSINTLPPNIRIEENKIQDSLQYLLFVENKCIGTYHDFYDVLSTAQSIHHPQFTKEEIKAELVQRSKFEEISSVLASVLASVVVTLDLILLLYLTK
jgi:hypothetical protein